MINYNIIIKNNSFDLEAFYLKIISSNLNLFISVIIFLLLVCITYADNYKTRFEKHKQFIQRSWVNIIQFIKSSRMNIIVYISTRFGEPTNEEDSKSYFRWFILSCVFYPIYLLLWYIFLSHLDYFYNYRIYELFTMTEEHPSYEIMKKLKFRKFSKLQDIRWFCLGMEGKILIAESDLMIYFFIYIFIWWNLYYWLTTIFYELEAIVDVLRTSFFLILFLFFITWVGVDVKIVKHYYRYCALGYYCPFGYLMLPIWFFGANAMEDYSDTDEEIDFYNVMEEGNFSDLDERWGGSELTVIFWSTAIEVFKLLQDIIKYTDIYRWILASDSYRRDYRRLEEMGMSIFTHTKFSTTEGLSVSDEAWLELENPMTNEDVMALAKTDFSIGWRLKVLEDKLTYSSAIWIWEFFYLGAIRLYRLYKKKTFTYFTREEEIFVVLFRRHNLSYKISGGNEIPQSEEEIILDLNGEDQNPMVAEFQGVNRMFIEVRKKKWIKGTEV